MKAKLLKLWEEAFFPQVRCLACDEPRRIAKGSPLCGSCLLKLEELRVGPHVCSQCLSPMKQGQACGFCAEGNMQGLQKTYAPFIYKDAVQQLIVKLKFIPCLTAVPLLAEAMAMCITGLSFDALVPVPLSREHFRERGMNQSLELCKKISLLCSIPIREALIKTGNTKRQSSLPAHRREKNVRDAFRTTQEVKGLKLLLVDDVRTTGATARACARALLSADADSVSLLCAAVASARYEAIPPQQEAAAAR